MDLDPNLRLSKLLSRTNSVRVRSRVLGEDVIWIADDRQEPDLLRQTGVVYRESELRQLVGVSPEKLRRIHATKKALDGQVIQRKGASP